MVGSLTKKVAVRWSKSAGFYVVSMLVGMGLVVPLVMAADAVIVSQRKRQFWPTDLQIPRGSVLRIKNDDKVTHHIFIKAPDMKFDSGEQPVGRTVEVQFDKAGKFTVRCAIHPIMRLNVEVR